MRKILLIIAILSSTVSFAQDWVYSLMIDQFDGDYEVAATIGEGKFPYNEPLLGVRVRDTDETPLQIVFANVAYGSTNSDLKILIAFDDEHKLYEYQATTSVDGSLWFTNATKESKLILIEKMKSSSVMKVRLSSSYGQDDYTFSLSGSTKEISKLTIN